MSRKIITIIIGLLFLCGGSICIVWAYTMIPGALATLQKYQCGAGLGAIAIIALPGLLGIPFGIGILLRRLWARIFGWMFSGLMLLYAIFCYTTAFSSPSREYLWGWVIAGSIFLGISLTVFWLLKRRFAKMGLASFFSFYLTPL